MSYSITSSLIAASSHINTKLNGVLKPYAAGFHVVRLCLTSPFPCIW